MKGQDQRQVFVDEMQWPKKTVFLKILLYSENQHRTEW